MKKRNVKLLVSGLTLGLAALTTVGSTYAWFTTNGQATVGGMDIQAEAAGNGIFVSKDGKKYDKAVSLEEYFKHGDANDQDSALLQPVTSLDGSVFSKLSADTFAKDNDDKDVFDYTHIVESKGNYVSFDLYFAITKDTKIQISSKDLAARQEGSDILKVARMSYAPYSKAAGSENLNPTADYTNALTNILRLQSKDDAQEDIAKQSMELLYGKTISNKSYGVYTSATDKNTDELDEIYDVENKTRLLSGAELDIISKGQTYATFTDVNDVKNLAIAEGEYNFVKVHFNFWLEGNDKLCSNKVASDSFTGTLTFTAVPDNA